MKKITTILEALKSPKVENSRKLSDEIGQRDFGGTIDKESNDNSKEQSDKNNKKKTGVYLNTNTNKNKELKDFTDIAELKKLLFMTKLAENFELIELIKKGGTGNVFKAKCKKKILQK